jgi:hypothetical protein
MAFLRPAAVCLAMMIGSLAFAAGAKASTIYTYNFTQSGYQNPSLPGVTGVLTGTFSGTADSLGFMDKSGLTAFSASFDAAFAGSFFANPIDGLSAVDVFSYDPANGASTLNIAAHAGPTQACVGAAAAFGLCIGSGNIGAVIFVLNGPIAGVFTSEAAKITLVSPVAATPIPAALPLFVASLGALGLFGCCKSRRQARATGRNGPVTLAI